MTVQPEKEDLFQIAADLTDGRGADVVLEVAGGRTPFKLPGRWPDPMESSVSLLCTERRRVFPSLKCMEKI